jgi:hypothetical protein
MAVTPRLRANSTSRPSKASTSTPGMSAEDSLSMAMRSSTVNRGCFPGLTSTATITESNTWAALATMSRWPLVTGS